MVKNKKLIENSISILLTQMVSYILPLATLPYLSRVLGVEKLGLIYWAQSGIFYFILFTDYGFNLSAVERIAKNKDNLEKINKITNSVLFIKVLLTIISFVALNFIIRFVPKFTSETTLFNLTFLMVIGNVLYPIWFFQGIEKMKYVTFFNITAKTIFVVSIFIFIKTPSDYLYVAFLNSCGYLLSGFLSIYIAIKKFNFKIIIPSYKNIIEEFKYSTSFFLAKTSETIYTNTNSFLLGLVTNSVLVGYYVAAEKIFSAINSIQCALTIPLYPHMTKNKDIKLYKKLFLVFLLLLVVLCSFTYISAPQIISIFYGEKMLPANCTLKIFSITLFFASICGMLGYPLLGAMGYSNKVNLSVVFASVIQIFVLSTLLIIKQFNITTLAFITSLPEIIMILVRVFYIKKYRLLKSSI